MNWRTKVSDAMVSGWDSIWFVFSSLISLQFHCLQITQHLIWFLFSTFKSATRSVYLFSCQISLLFVSWTFNALFFSSLLRMSCPFPLNTLWTFFSESVFILLQTRRLSFYFSPFMSSNRTSNCKRSRDSEYLIIIFGAFTSNEWMQCL